MEPRPVKKEKTAPKASGRRSSKKKDTGFVAWMSENRILLLGLLGMLPVIAVVVALIIWGITLYTRHDKEIQLPDFVGLSVPQADELAQQTKVRTVVVDTIFNRGVARGSVVRQVPSAGSMVKRNRTVRLTINAMAPRNIPVPDVLDEPFKTAVSDLDKWGFELGKLTYVSDRATNRVIRLTHKGRTVKAGTLLPGGSTIDLVLGLADNDMMVKVPCAIGMDYKTALRTVKLAGLNTGSVIFDRDIKTYQDSLNACVYKQNPDYFRLYHHLGGSVSLYLTLDRQKIPQIVVETAEEEDGEQGSGSGEGAQGFGTTFDASVLESEIVED